MVEVKTRDCKSDLKEVFEFPSWSLTATATYSGTNIRLGSFNATNDVTITQIVPKGTDGGILAKTFNKKGKFKITVEFIEE